MIINRRIKCFIFIFTVIAQHTLASDKSEALSKAHFEFSLDIYKTLLKDQEGNTGNLVISPYSLNVALSMLFLGTSSSSNSSRQLRSLMHFDGISYVDIHNEFKKVVANFDSNYYITKMKVAHGLYVASDVAISPPYDRALREFYHSKVEHMDFRNADVIQTLGAINDYINEVTEGEIPAMLDRSPEKDSRLLMLDAMALSTRWLHPFDPDDTFSKGLFFSPTNQRLEVPTMSGKFQLPLGYSAEMECRVLELPFSQKRISMFLLLPDDPVDGLANLESNISTENIKTLFSTLKDEVVNVKLPKFKLNANFEMRDTLRSLGLEDLVQKQTSDLSLMAPGDTLQLSQFRHRSSFQVSEGGSVVQPPKGTSTSFDEKHFEVDHSFLFLVWDYYSGMLLLMGRVVNPLME